MEKIEQLKEIISYYWQLADHEVDWDVQFNSLELKNFSSLRMLRFLASVEERFNVSIEEPDAIKRFGDLVKLIEPQWAQ